MVLYFVGRNQLLHMAFNRAQKHIKETYQADLTVDEIHFTGFTKVHIAHLCLKPDNSDTLAMIEELEFRPRLYDLLRGKIGFNELKLKNANINVVDIEGQNNINRFRHTALGQENLSDDNGYRKTFSRYESKLLQLLNTKLQVEDVRINYRDTAYSENLLIPELIYDLHNLDGTIINELLKDTFTLNGVVLKNGARYSFAINHSGSSNYLPFLNRERKLNCNFKSVSGEINFKDEGDALKLNITLKSSALAIKHWRLANDNVAFNDLAFCGNFIIKDDSYELDSASTVTVNHVPFNAYVYYQRKPDSVFSLSLHMPETVSDTFFNALPDGTCSTLRGISCSGTLAYDLQFSMDLSQPDSLIFNSEMHRKNFHINHFGRENYSRINEAFAYDAYDKDRLIRRIIIGPENPAFTPIDRINPQLINCVLQAEDPSFMTHRGFLMESIRESISKNYKERRFARGGSTISMQLVKNVFLNRDKTVSRKLEEVLIVYLIENLGLISKDRMLEIYLNAIEWGPGVYGIGEASRFYFNKSPANLNLQECLFLAAIIPNPKYFKYQFDKQGQLKSYMTDFFKLLTARMAKHGWVNEQDTTNNYNLKLTGPAQRMVLPNDTILIPTDEELMPVDE
jgi:hypothetical protein